MTRGRSEAYLAFVRSHASCLSWSDPTRPYPPAGEDGIPEDWEPCVAHHVRLGNRGGMGLKPSDYETVPLTDDEHKALHGSGERAFWDAAGIDPNAVIATLIGKWLGIDVARYFLDSWRDTADALKGIAEAR